MNQELLNWLKLFYSAYGYIETKNKVIFLLPNGQQHIHNKND
jgi:hypothetical protein